MLKKKEDLGEKVSKLDTSWRGRVRGVGRYRPPNYADGQEELMENWRSLLEAVAESFVARGDNE